MQDALCSLADEKASLAFGASFSHILRPGLVIYLLGDLGAGKTTFVRGLLQAMGVTGTVKSPTYNLLEIYELASVSVLHFDLYRIVEAEEWLDAGFDEMLTYNTISLIEWPMHADTYLPQADMVFDFSVQDMGRVCKISGYSSQGIECLKIWQALQEDNY